ncbi:PREDICTED: branched-chain-amino-acid aminotransferase, cytosolic-like [Amphimedon queenslandica]|uniref:Branched-chain-amino-acid aminotransferase n=1 Tax=Amphimedon queenslandica TaxID=400682 RepID=A0A1X7UI08_AMPQE|nr:PREDICTED: branched-chain-amino-acid aminotransferase, cytosolic-like [Amphimedon queenslandica]|eukprot:XP_003387852.1 PREDICTED: branched-chain-amino-acid aminotransferase, cytosolic-like [Amphimedon queenslandica]
MALLRFPLRLNKVLTSPAISTSIRSVSSLKYDGIKVSLTDNPKVIPPHDKLIFGQVFTDHMLTINWSHDDGWNTPHIVPYDHLSISPAAACFHYAVECFEGMKAYRGVDDKIRLFRPMENMKRLNNSARAASLPEFDGEEFVKCLKELVRIDQKWIPAHSTKCSLYIRPTFIATEPIIGVQKCRNALLYCINCPVGPYFPKGTFNPVKLYADPAFVRAWHGGVGESKMGGNYGPTIRVQTLAESEKNCDQVLWLYGEDRQLTEVGTMNIFMHWINEDGDPEIATPPLNGIILPGVTRDSLLALGKTWGTHKISERKITMDDIKIALAEGRIKEMFGAGTACVVCPISDILYLNESLHIPTMENGPEVAKRFYKELTDIQYGVVEHDWTVVVD